MVKWPCRESETPILDEFTRGTDINTRYEVYELMYQLTLQGVTVIMISSELPEVIRASDRVLVMCEGGMTGELGRKELEQDRILKYAMVH